MAVKMKIPATARGSVCFIAGYAAMLSVQFALFHGFMPFGSTDVGGQGSSGFYIAALVAKTSALAGLLLLCERQPASFIRWAGIFALFAFSLGFAVMSMSLRFCAMVPSAEIAPWFAAGGVCFGCADAAMLLLWGRAFASLSPKRMYPFVLSGNLAGLFGYGLMGAFPLAGSALAAVFFLASLAGVVFVDRNFAKCASRNEYEVDACEDARRFVVASDDFRKVASFLWRPASGLALFCFMAGLMTKVSGQESVSFAETQAISIVASAACIIVLALPVLFLRSPSSIDRMFGLALPLSATGFLLLPVFGSAAPAVVNAFAQCGSMMASMVVWCMMARCVRFVPGRAVSLYAGVLALASFAELCGLLAGCSNLLLFSQESTPSTAVALASLYLLSCCSLFVFRPPRRLVAFWP